MIAKHIYIWPDELLSERCDPAQDFEFAGALGSEMLDLMYSAGVRALAAPQVGVAQRVIVLDCGWEDGESVDLICVNPHIQAVSDIRASSEESALSVPGVTAYVKRPIRIALAYYDIEGQRLVAEFDGPDAVIVQQAMDHLEGLTVLDHLAADARAEALAEYEMAV